MFVTKSPGYATRPFNDWPPYNWIKYCILNEVITQATPTPLGKPSILGIYKGLVASFQHG